MLAPMLGKLSEPMHQSDWYKLIPRVEYALNNSVHSSTRCTPSMLLFGTDQRGPILDDLTEYLQTRLSPGSPPDLLAIRQTAHERIEKSQARNERINDRGHPKPAVFS